MKVVLRSLAANAKPAGAEEADSTEDRLNNFLTFDSPIEVHPKHGSLVNSNMKSESRYLLCSDFDVLVQGLEYYGECRPAGPLCGDFFDFAALKNSALIVTTGSVRGNSVPASLIMATIRACSRELQTGSCGNLSRSMDALNAVMYETFRCNSFASLFRAIIAPAELRLRYTSAGQETALLMRGNKSRVRRLERTGTVLGLSHSIPYRERMVRLETGDMLAIFSSGVTDAMDAQGHELGETGVLQLLEDYRDAPARDLAGRILDAVEDFSCGAAPADDRTAVIVRCTGSAQRLRIREAAEMSLTAA